MTGPVRVAAQRTVRIENAGCGDPVFGSAFPVAHGYVVTNAHVVAGALHDLTVLSGNQQLSATVVLFDPQLDIAVLRTAHLPTGTIHASPLTTASRATLVGFGSGQRHLTPVTIRSVITATVRDIYNTRDVRRRVIVMGTRVQEGDSGGPVLDASGRYVGVVVGYDLSNRDVGYAIPADDVRRDIERGMMRRAAVSPGRCRA